MRALVNKNCIGCNFCVDVCPLVFAMREDGAAESIVDPIPLEAEGCCVKAADECPVSAIAIQE